MTGYRGVLSSWVVPSVFRFLRMDGSLTGISIIWGWDFIRIKPWQVVINLYFSGTESFTGFDVIECHGIKVSVIDFNFLEVRGIQFLKYYKFWLFFLVLSFPFFLKKVFSLFFFFLFNFLKLLWFSLFKHKKCKLDNETHCGKDYGFK